MASLTKADRLRALLFAAFVIGVLLTSFPQQRVSRTARVRLAPLYDLTASVQGWAMFAPNPGTTAPHLRVEIRYDDGTTETFTPLVPPRWQLLRDRRWEKVSKEMTSNDNYELWEPLARNLLAEHEARGRGVADVVLIRVTNVDPGIDSDLEPFEVATPIYSLDDGILLTVDDATTADTGLDQ